MKIEVREYVRTYEGHIGKIVDLDIDVGICLDNLKEPLTIDMIVKHSKNIVDLIEIGDVLKIKEDNSICYIGLEKDETTLTYQEIIDEIKNNKIKLLAIVTKEKFRNIEYKIKEVE